MIDLSPNKKIVITGAGGWLGTELLELLLAEYGSEVVKASVLCLGSKNRILSLSDGTQLPVALLSDPFTADNVAGVVHLAFLTRDKVAVFGTEQYSYQNLAITSHAIRLIEELKPAWIATVSSGAVFSTPGGPLENDLKKNPYGFTKRVEETMLTQVAKDLGAHIAIGRLWGAMGAHMPINRAYAVSDFIMQAIETNQIKINADHEVWRRYCDAGQFMNVLASSAEKFSEIRFDSGGNLIEIELIFEILSRYEFPNLKLSRPQIRGVANDYYPESNLYEKLLTEFNLLQATIETLVNVTAESHKSNANFGTHP